jgi:hypothetical protein
MYLAAGIPQGRTVLPAVGATTREGAWRGTQEHALEQILDSTHAGVTLYNQQKYIEAEQLLQQPAQQREKVLGAEHIDTLKSKYWLALTLYNQQKYTEAEQLLQQSAQQQEKVLGTEHKDTLERKYWLAVTLYNQQKYTEAEQLLQQLVLQQEKVLGAEHTDTETRLRANAFYKYY